MNDKLRFVRPRQRHPSQRSPTRITVEPVSGPPFTAETPRQHAMEVLVNTRCDQGPHRAPITWLQPYVNATSWTKTKTMVAERRLDAPSHRVTSRAILVLISNILTCVL